MDRVVHNLVDPVIIYFMLGVAIGFLHFNPETPKGWRDST